MVNFHVFVDPHVDRAIRGAADLLEGPVSRYRQDHEPHGDVRQLAHCPGETLLPSLFVDRGRIPPMIQIPFFFMEKKQNSMLMVFW